MALEVVNIDASARDWHPKIRDFLLETDDVYPGVDRWWERRVVPGFSAGQRTCRIICDHERVVALAIGRYSARSAKLCTLRVLDRYRGQGAGRQLIHSILADLLSRGCARVHFTISERTQDECGQFFAPYGFELLGWYPDRYAPGMEELVFGSSAESVRRALEPWRAWLCLPNWFSFLFDQPTQHSLGAAGNRSTFVGESHEQLFVSLATSMSLNPFNECVLRPRLSKLLEIVPQSSGKNLATNLGHLTGL